MYFNCLNCHRREEDIVWESGCKLFIGCIWTQKSDWWRRSTGFLFLDSLSAIKLSRTYRMYAQFALVEHSGKKGSDFCQKVSHLESSANFPKCWEWKAISRGTMLKLTEHTAKSLSHSLFGSSCMKLRSVSSVTRECGNLSVLFANSLETIWGRNLIGRYFLPQIALHLAFRIVEWKTQIFVKVYPVVLYYPWFCSRSAR